MRKFPSADSETSAMKSCASAQEQLKTAEGKSREYEARSKAGKTDPKALQRERLVLDESVKKFEEKFSSSGSSVSDEGYRSQGGEGDFKSGSQPILPRYEVVIDKTFVNGFRFGGNEGLGQDENQGLSRCNSAPARLEADNCPSITPQPTTSRQPLVAGTQARSR